MGCCGAGKRSNMEYEVTFKDGTTRRFATAGEARPAARADTSSDPTGRRKAATIRTVLKSAP